MYNFEIIFFHFYQRIYFADKKKKEINEILSKLDYGKYIIIAYENIAS